jgi:hypothetical protein
MSDAIIYDQDGRILRSVSAPDDQLIQQAGLGESVLLGVGNDLTQYVFQGEIIDRPVFPLAVSKTALLADGIDAVEITSIPANTSVVVDSITHVVTDGSLTVTATQTGEMKLTFSKFPYIDREVILNAT